MKKGDHVVFLSGNFAGWQGIIERFGWAGDAVVRLNCKPSGKMGIGVVVTPPSNLRLAEEPAP